MNSHPEQALLLRYVDGELPEPKLRSVQQHLEACPECRAELEELQATAADCVRYQDRVFEALPAPPREWRDIYRDFDQMDAAAPRRAFFPWRWGLAAATVALAVAGVTYYKAHEASLGLSKTGKTEFAVANKITEPLLRNSADSGAAPVEVPPRPAVPSRPAAIVPGPTASISDELEVLSVLHAIGADLGDPVQVSLSDNRVQVSGVGLAPERKEKILAALQPLPNVAIHFSNPAAAPLPSDAGSTPPVTAKTAPNPWQTKLESQLGVRGALDRFTGQVLNSNESAMAHAYALHLLAQQFPSDASMSDHDRGTLRGLAGDHLKAIRTSIADFDRSLIPVLNGLGANAGSPPPATATVWQAATDQVFQAARQCEVLSSILLGVTPVESAHADLPSELLASLSNLRADLEQNQRLLGR